MTGRRLIALLRHLMLNSNSCSQSLTTQQTQNQLTIKLTKLTQLGTEWQIGIELVNGSADYV